MARTESKTKLLDAIEEELKEIRRVRDEMRVQGHLAKAEVRDAWDRLMDEIPVIEAKARKLEDEAQDIRTATSGLLRQLKESLAHVRKQER